MFKKMIDKYADRNKEITSYKGETHLMNGLVLSNTADSLFDTKSVMVNEVVKYCKSQGFDEIDKIIFLTSYDIEFSNDEREVHKVSDNTVKIIKKNKMDSNSVISIIEKDGKTIARVFMGTSISLDKIL
jgi:hypothetical protein